MSTRNRFVIVTVNLQVKSRMCVKKPLRGMGDYTTHPSTCAITERKVIETELFASRGTLQAEAIV